MFAFYFIAIKAKYNAEKPFFFYLWDKKLHLFLWSNSCTIFWFWALAFLD